MEPCLSTRKLRGSGNVQGKIMVVEVFTINLDKPSQQYSAGEVVSGNVFLKISGEEATFEIRVKFFGSADTHWAEKYSHNSGGYARENGHIYEAHETFFEFTAQVFGNGVDECSIPEGENTFPFTFKVPKRPFPASCSFPEGGVIYGLEGVIQRKFSKLNPKTEMYPVTIFPTLTDLRDTGDPVQVEKNCTFIARCCFCCIWCCWVTKPCVLKSFTQQSGYCLGEVVPFILDIENKSNKKLFHITATLTQVWTLYADGIDGRHKKSRHVELQVEAHPDIDGGGTVKWETNFTIPPTIPSTSDSSESDVVRVDYEIEVKGLADGWNNKFSLIHPIVIGNNPPKGSSA